MCLCKDIEVSFNKFKAMPTITTILPNMVESFSLAILNIIFVLCLMYIPETVRMSVPGVDAQVPVSMVFMFLCGLCTSVMFGSIFNLATEGLGKYTPMASGIFMALICGGGIIPFVQNFVADLTNYMTSYWVIIASLAYMLAYGLFFSKNVNKDIPTV